METIQIEKNNQIATVVLNRPELHNAFNDVMIGELTEAFNQLSSDDDLRLIVLKGEGKSFCAGADLNWMRSMKDYSFEENYQDSQKLRSLFEAIDFAPVPVIGAVHGHALGGGVGLVCVCDYVLASDRAKLGFTEVKLGLIPAVISPFCFKKIGASNARAYFLSGEVFSSEIAKQIGLVHQVVERDNFDEALENVISRYLLAGPQAAREAKKLYRELESGREDIGSYTCQAIAKLRISEEGQEGMTSLLSKRSPTWVGGHS